VRSGPSDTDPTVAAMLIAAHRRMSAREKMRRVLACNAASEAMARAGLRARHGAMPEEETRLRLAALRLGRETMAAVFGWQEPGGDG
jgi:hypothetical protein